MGNQWPGSDWPGSDWPGSDRPGSGGPDWSAFGDHFRRTTRGQGGPPPWLQEIFGFAAPQRPAPRGPKVRRGDVRTAIIDVLFAAGRTDQPINGYQVIQEIAERSGHEWRPSPGSVYPTIQQLHDEGLVESDDERGRKTIRLTDEGRQWAQEHAEELAAVWAPFEHAQTARRVADSAGQTPRADLKSEIGQVVSAVWQLVTQGSERQRSAALDVLVDTRRRLYGILADGRDGRDGSAR